VAANNFPNVVNGQPVDADLWFNAVGKAVTALQGGLPTASAYKSTGQATIVASLANDNDLFFSVVGPAAYVVVVEGGYTAATAGGIRFGLTVPAGASMVNGTVLSEISGTARFLQSSSNMNVTGLFPANTNPTSFRLAGTLVTTAAGVAQFQFGQSTLNVTGTTLLAGTYIMGIRIA
jgi:hypothetical protein